MRKKYIFLPVAMLLVPGCNPVVEEEPPVAEHSVIDDFLKPRQLLSDADFSQGFKLLEPIDDGSRVFAPNIDYGGEADGEGPVWEMSQWSTPYDFKNATFTKLGEGKYKYTNESRNCVVDVPKSSITMELNSWTEYQKKLGHSRTGSEGWSHFLIEQSFKEPAYLKDIKNAVAHCKFKINKSDNMDIGQPIPCSQLTWYFTVCDPKNGDPAYQSGDNTNDYMWFGLPFFDSRYEYLPGGNMIDQGFNGATNKLITSVDNRRFFDEYVVVGKEYTIDFDFYKALKDSLNYGMANGCFADSLYANLCLNYMNLGWELPGSYDVSLTVSDLSVVVEEK